MLFDAVVNLILVFLLVGRFKIYGVYIAISVLAVLNTFFVHQIAKYKIKFNICFKRLGELIKYGFPLLVTGFLGQILRTLDTIMIAKMLGVTLVGYYSVGLMAKGYLYGLSNNLGIVTMPHMQEVYGKSQNPEDIKKFVTHSTEAISYLLAPFLGFIYIVAPLLIKQFLPQYIPGILALQILLLDTYFRSCSPQSQQFIVSIGKQARIIPISIIAICVNVLFNYIFIKIGWGIYGVALGTSIASFLAFVATLFYAMKHFTNTKEIIIFLLRIIFPMVYILGVLLLSAKAINVSNIYIELAVRIAILVVAAIPLLIHLEIKMHVFSTLIKLITKRHKR